MKKKPDKLHSKRISIRFPSELYIYILAEAEKSKKTISCYIRGLLPNTVGRKIRIQKPKPTPDIEVLRTILAHLGKIGSNINQIARKINQNRMDYKQEEYVIKTMIALNKMREILYKTVNERRSA